jgi:hypothetical protein
MNQARDPTNKSAEPLRRRQPEEHQPDGISREHALLQFQRAAGNRAVVSLLESRGQLQTKLRSYRPGDEFEHEADVAAEQVPQLTTAPTGMPQRKCSTCTPRSKCAECEEEEETVQRKPKTLPVPALQLKTNAASAAPHIQRAPRNGDSATTLATAEEAEPTAGPGALIVEDDAATVAPGQMRKSEFLEQLRSTVCTTADEALAEAGQSAEGCPYIEKWLSHYAEQEPAHIERALRKYTPEAAAATSARDYVTAVSNRVRRAVDTWARTGEITGVPDELAGMLNGPGAALGAVAGVLGSIGSAIGGAISAAAGAVGSAFSSIGKALFKRKEGHATASDDPQEIQAQLSSGQPLDGGAKSRMGAAFGHDFSGVRVHTDAGAAGLSNQLNARAFTVGSDIAFGAGEYQPGTLIGDALIAHELAHVVQQSGGDGAGPPRPKGGIDQDSLEEYAYVSAVGAVISAWGGVKGAITDIGRSAMPRMRSGLRLQSCRREKNVTPAEADTFIRNRFGDNLAAAIAAGTTTEGNVNVVDDAGFRVAYTRVYGSIDEEYTETAAFVERSTTPPTVWIHKELQHTATVIHEGLHVYSDTALRDYSLNANEGVTEYFTRQIVEEQKLADRSGYYEEEFTEANELVKVVGDAVMRRAYFEGDIDGLRSAVDSARSAYTFDNWIINMDVKNWVGARAALAPAEP